MGTFIEFLTEGGMLITESKNDFERLQKNKVPLDPDERNLVMQRGATWNNHPDPKKNPVSAVWKSKNKKTGKVTYVTNTHRAYNTAPTLKGAIRRYHVFIKGTA